MCPEHSSKSYDPNSDRGLLPHPSMMAQGGWRASGKAVLGDTGLGLSTDDGVHSLWIMEYGESKLGSVLDLTPLE